MKKNLLMLLCAVSFANFAVQADDTGPGPETTTKSPWFGRRWYDKSKSAALEEANRNSFGANVDHYGDIAKAPKWSRPFRTWSRDAVDYGRSVGRDWQTRWNNGWFKAGDGDDRAFSRNSFVPGVAATAGRLGLAGGLGYGYYKNAYQNALIKLLRLLKLQEEGRAMQFARGRSGKVLANMLAGAGYLGADAAMAYGANQRSLAGMGLDGMRSFDRGISSLWYNDPSDDTGPSQEEVDAAAAAAAAAAQAAADQAAGNTDTGEEE